MVALVIVVVSFFNSCTQFEINQCICVYIFMCAAELYLNSCKFDSAYACIQEAANYNPVSHAVSYMVCVMVLGPFPIFL